MYNSEAQDTEKQNKQKTSFQFPHELSCHATSHQNLVIRIMNHKQHEP